MAVVAATLGAPRMADASTYCTQGIGEGCADLAEGNALIQALQEKSAANKERNEKVRTHKQHQTNKE